MDNEKVLSAAHRWTINMITNKKFIDYDELFKIFHKKHKATHEEIKYWVKNNELTALKSDVPPSCFIQSFWYRELNQSYNVELSFYQLDEVNKFIPLSHERFVYIQDLAGHRHWHQHARSETNLYSNFPALDRAAHAGLLRFYDKELDRFTLFQTSKSGNPKQDRLWIYTKEGQEYVSNTDNFFLLQDIIDIERIFFKRPLKECLEELGLNPKEYE